MDVVKELFSLLIEYGILLIGYLAPYKLEIVIGLVFATFFIGLFYSYR